MAFRAAIGPALRLSRRYSITSNAARFHEYGNPANVLRLEAIPLEGKLGDNEVLVKMEAAPISPADLNTIEGTYGKKVNFPAVAGNEGVAKILEVGSSVKNVAVGDLVIPVKSGFGTWRTHAVAASSDVLKVPSDIKAEYLSVISSGASTAFRLLADFEKLEKDDVIIQNAGNSTVATAVAQIAAARGIKVISVVRDADHLNERLEWLKRYGAHIAVTEAYVRTPQFKRLISDLPAPKLALNATGGRSATELVRFLGNNGTMVTYGAMSRRPVEVSNSALIFKNVTLKGFWMTAWYENNSIEKRQQMLNEICELYRQNKLRHWVERHEFANFGAALARHYEPQKNRKIVLTF